MLLKIYSNINSKLRSLLKVGSLFSLIAIPVQSPDNFVDLQYKDIKPNKVEIGDTIKIDVENSASPLFYKFDEVKKWNSISVSGKIDISKKLESEQKDAYFQIGVIYEGDYRPGWLVRNILPEWLLTIINLNSKYGLDAVDFHHFSKEKGFEPKTESIRDIKLNFISVGPVNEEGSFNGDFKLKDKKILGLWLRADGDDHDGFFTTEVQNLSIHP
ncbi:MAG: hypothetical protein CME65_01665 [Halobacteriovoraceae bacterium]|nr:hypothetical protein [Halobacteriovoraceae bacterium]|tara:strand:+ start:2835 stop:3479 length:645 start_codon:yes stop_codon:yes gene_type:complete